MLQYIANIVASERHKIPTVLPVEKQQVCCCFLRLGVAGLLLLPGG